MEEISRQCRGIGEHPLVLAKNASVSLISGEGSRKISAAENILERDELSKLLKSMLSLLNSSTTVKPHFILLLGLVTHLDVQDFKSNPK